MNETFSINDMNIQNAITNERTSNNNNSNQNSKNGDNDINNNNNNKRNIHLFKSE